MLLSYLGYLTNGAIWEFGNHLLIYIDVRLNDLNSVARYFFLDGTRLAAND